MKKLIQIAPLILFLACGTTNSKQDKIISINNEEIKYSVHNPDSDIACFFIHGFGDNQQSFHLLYPILDSLNIKMVIYDMPGMGENINSSIGMEQNLKLFSELFKKERAYRNIAIGHSMGGLFMLLSTIENNLNFDEIIAIEPSITEPDNSFFKYIQEPPLGVGVDAFASKERNEVGYNKFYNKSIKNSNITELKRLAKEVYQSFENSRKKIIDSELSFTYVYGEDSSGIEYRKGMSRYPSITTKGFKNAKHWVHFDAITEFKEFMIDKVITRKTK